MGILDKFRRKPKDAPFIGDAFEARRQWMQDALNSVPEGRRQLIADKLTPALRDHVAATGETLSQTQVQNVVASLANKPEHELQNLSHSQVREHIDPKFKPTSGMLQQEALLKKRQSVIDKGHLGIDSHSDNRKISLRKKLEKRGISEEGIQRVLKSEDEIARTAKDNFTKTIESRHAAAKNPDEILHPAPKEIEQHHRDARPKPNAPAKTPGVSEEHLKNTPADPVNQQRAELKERLQERLQKNPVDEAVMKRRQVLKEISDPVSGKGAATGVNSEVLRQEKVRVKTLGSTSKTLGDIHALEGSVVKHQDTHFGSLSAEQQKARLNYLSHEHALPAATNRLQTVKASSFKAREWQTPGIKGTFVQHNDGTVLHIAKKGSPILIARGAEHEMHMAAATSTRIQRTGTAVASVASAARSGVKKGASATRSGTAKGASAVGLGLWSGAKKGASVGMRTLKFGAIGSIAVAGLGALAYFTSSARSHRAFDPKTITTADQLDNPVPQLLDFTTPAQSGPAEGHAANQWQNLVNARRNGMPTRGSDFASAPSVADGATELGGAQPDRA